MACNLQNDYWRCESHSVNRHCVRTTSIAEWQQWRRMAGSCGNHLVHTLEWRRSDSRVRSSVTNFMELRPWRADSHFVTKNVCNVSDNPKVYCRALKSHALVSIRSQISPSIRHHSISPRSMLILSTHLCLRLLSGLFPSGFPTNTLYSFIVSHIRSTCPENLNLPDHGFSSY
jgi:hypothetical protein